MDWIWKNRNITVFNSAESRIEFWLLFEIIESWWIELSPMQLQTTIYMSWIVATPPWIQLNRILKNGESAQVWPTAIGLETRKTNDNLKHVTQHMKLISVTFKNCNILAKILWKYYAYFFHYGLEISVVE